MQKCIADASIDFAMLAIKPRWTLIPSHPQEPHMFIDLTKTWQGKQPGERIDLADADAKKQYEPEA